MERQATLDRHPVQAISPRAWLLTATIGGLLIVSFLDPIRWMVERWTLPDSYYSHGFLVPLVALYFVWRDRTALLALRPERSLFGLACFAVGLLILVASGFFVFYSTAGFAMILTLWGLCGFVFGRRAMRRLALPAILLLFMVPPPLQMIDDLSMKLKLLVANVTIQAMRALGIAAVRDGSTIYLNDAVVTVGNACSGLRSLISLLFLGVLFAALIDAGWIRRTVLFLASMPIAFVSNVARVLVLCLVAESWGSDAVMARWGLGPVKTSAHDLSGYLIFVVAFGLLYLTLLLLNRWRRGPGTPAEADALEQPAPGPAPPPNEDRSPPPRRNGMATRLALVIVLLAATAMVSATSLYPSKMERAELRTQGIPMQVGVWAGRAIALDESVRQILETDDVIQRDYYHPLYGNRPVDLAVVFSPSNRRVAHPPEVCYIGGGWEVSSKQFREEEGLPRMVRLTLHHGRRQTLVYYCFKAGDAFTANYYQQQFNIVRNMLLRRSTSSALVRFSTKVDDIEGEEQARRRLLDFARQIMPLLEQQLK